MSSKKESGAEFAVVRKTGRDPAQEMNPRPTMPARSVAHKERPSHGDFIIALARKFHAPKAPCYAQDDKK